jgi:hypothetical protein
VDIVVVSISFGGGGAGVSVAACSTVLRIGDCIVVVICGSLTAISWHNTSRVLIIINRSNSSQCDDRVIIVLLLHTINKYARSVCSASE